MPGRPQGATATDKARHWTGLFYIGKQPDDMSGYEHYDEELAKLDHEIMHYAAICAVDLRNRGEIEACLRVHHSSDWSHDKARETLRGLLVLRIKIEEEMISAGKNPPPLLPADLVD